jgi:anthranilate phosphoribosyltransferase
MLQELTRQLTDGQDLEEAQGELALAAVLDPATPDQDIADFLCALADKGESVSEVTAFARGMRQAAVKIRNPWPVLVDTAGTGGGRSSFNVSTAAAFVIAAAGVPVAKHGNRAITSRSGSADVLRELGVSVERGPEVAEKALAEARICFLFAPLFHPAMKRVAEIRRRLGRRTIFNLVGPLTNPASAPVQLVGAYSQAAAQVMARALARLGCRRAWVVHSRDGLDEISSVAETDVSEVQGDQVRETFFTPTRPQTWIPEGGEPAHNAALILQVLENRADSASRELVLVNAAAALHLALGEDVHAARERAAEALDSGRARARLAELVRCYS